MLGEYNAKTAGSICTLFNASGVAIANASGVTGSDGSVSLANVVLPTGLVYSSCSGGTYTDEATGQATNAPNIRAAVIYSGTGKLSLFASPISEISFRLADTNGGDLTTIAAAITTQNAQTATAFGLDGVDITSIIPTDINTTAAANDAAGKFGTVLAAISQMQENSATDGGQTPSTAEYNVLIAQLVADMADGDIDGIADNNGNIININQAINNFKTGTGVNNPASDTGNSNVTTTPSVILNTTSIAFPENGTATYTVVLNTQPTGDVTITPVSSDTGAATVSGVMTFTTVNWNTPQTVTVTGVIDADTSTETVTISHTIAGGDYASVTSADVTAIVGEFTISAQTRSIAENSANATNVGAVLVTTGSPTGFSITSGNTNTAFAISNSGQITVADVNELDFETTTSYTLAVEITKADTTSQSANITVNVTDVFETETITFNSLTYATIQSPDTDRVWLDRNLGATQVATSSTDSAAYGDLHQWGRATDGHELRSATTVTATLATTISPGVNAFVTNSTAPYDWTSADSAGSSRVSAWSSGGANDICPSGFSVPTEAELVADTINATTTDITNGATAFSSFLKIPVAGYRNRVVGALRDAGSYAFLWSRSAYGAFGRGLGIGGTLTDFYSLDRAGGFSVRCIKD
ncbi:hypothetical protein CRYPA_1949 [uncultured Candidatus Thioglobus sp.]|nr:hypothetical protein CRYPA_1949 [uncultured Candidatus Thioglobus sp.]